MTTRKSLVRIIKTGKEIVVKSYGNGAIDAAGNFYHATEYKFIMNA